MKLLVVSHACITPVNQSFYADVAQSTGWDVSLVIPSTWTNEYAATAQVNRWKTFQGEIYPMPVWKPGNIPLHFYRQWMIGFLRKQRPDVIYMHHEPYGLATAQIYLANQLVDRAPIGFYAAQNIAKTYPIPFRWMESFVFKHSSFAFPVTEGALAVIRDKGYAGEAEVLPLAVDAELYHPDPVRAAEWRTRLNIAPDEFVIGYLGRLVPEKGLATLLQALSRLGGGRWRCVLAGSGAEEARLRAQAAEAGMSDRVIFTGFVPHAEAPGLLAAFDVLVLASEDKASWKEQFGRVIVEANACGTAVIGSDSGEIPNVLHATGGGVVVPQRDVEALSKAIADLVVNPEKARHFAEVGAAAVRNGYDQGYLASRFAQTISRSSLRKGEN